VDGSLIGQIKVLRARESAKALHARILACLTREKNPELGDIRVVYGPRDFDQTMPRYITAFLSSRFATHPLKPARYRLPTPGNETVGDVRKIVGISGKVLREESLFVENAPDERRYHRNGDDQRPIGAEREWYAEE